MSRIFIIEDDNSLRRELSRLLELQGFDVASCDGAGAAEDIARDAADASPDAVLLDLMLPETDGHSVCRALRSQTDAPIIMLTASNRELDEVLGLGIGADDYITKPYSPATLIARIQALLRRANSAASLTLSHGGVTLDVASGRVALGDQAVDLTRNELHILSMLMRNHGVVISRSELMRELWESDQFVDDNTLTVNINRLRKSLSSIGAPEDFISTKRGMGYVIDD